MVIEEPRTSLVAVRASSREVEEAQVLAQALVQVVELEHVPVAAKLEHGQVVAEPEHVPVAAKLEHGQVVAEPEHVPVVAKLEHVPEAELGHARVAARRLRTKSAIAVHRRGQVRVPKRVEDLAVVAAETTRGPAATEAAAAWAAAVTAAADTADLAAVVAVDAVAG
jgi:hypothetical protein